MDLPEYALELLLAYGGRVHYFASGHTLRFAVRLVGKSPRTPHGVAFDIVDEQED